MLLHEEPKEQKEPKVDLSILIDQVKQIHDKVDSQHDTINRLFMQVNYLTQRVESEGKHYPNVSMNLLYPPESLPIVKEKSEQMSQTLDQVGIEYKKATSMLSFPEQSAWEPLDSSLVTTSMGSIFSPNHVLASLDSVEIKQVHIEDVEEEEEEEEEEEVEVVVVKQEPKEEHIEKEAVVEVKAELVVEPVVEPVKEAVVEPIVEVKEEPKVEEEEVEEEEEEEEEGIAVEEITFNGKTYLKDSEDFIYNEGDETPIGYWKDKTNSIMFYRTKK
jgi:hypothetical protein